MASLDSASLSEFFDAVTSTSTPLAPDRSMPSSSGQATACSAAMRARSGPLAAAVPIMALPGSPMTVRTSSKSTFTPPYSLMISEMPPTAFFSTSLACAKASACVTSSPSTSSSFSLRMTISESTLASSSARPSSALLMRLPPSQSKGLVTTPTVRMPISLATRAITGAAPVPVPPPMPAVMKSMCAPSMALRISSIAASAASRPLAGLPPAPRPLLPSWISLGALLRESACASVLAQENCTPWTPRSIMCATALPPPPPTPMTLICVPWLNSSTSIISMAISDSLDMRLLCCRCFWKLRRLPFVAGSVRRGRAGASPSFVEMQGRVTMGEPQCVDGHG